MKMEYRMEESPMGEKLIVQCWSLNYGSGGVVCLDS